MSEEQLARLFGDVTVVQFILWILAAALFIGFVIKAWPWLVKLVSVVNALVDLPDKLKLVDEIHHEVRPNTGTSLNDAVRRVEADVKLQGRQLADQTGEIEKIREQLESGDAELSGRITHLENTWDPKKGGPDDG